MSAANFIQDFHEPVSRSNRPKQGSSPVTTEGDKMKIALPVMPLEWMAHGTKPAPLKPKGAAPPLYTILELKKWYASPMRSRQEEKKRLCATRLRARQLDPFLGPAVAAGATTVAAGLNTVAGGVARAVPYIGTGLLATADAVGIVAVVREGYAAATGKCHP